MTPEERRLLTPPIEILVLPIGVLLLASLAAQVYALAWVGAWIHHLTPWP